MWVTGVVTQGASRAGSAEYLKTFKVAYSLDGRKFRFLQEADGTEDQVGQGTQDMAWPQVQLVPRNLQTQTTSVFCYGDGSM